MVQIAIWLPKQMDADLNMLVKASGRNAGQLVQLALKETFGVGNLGADTKEIGKKEAEIKRKRLKREMRKKGGVVE